MVSDLPAADSVGAAQERNHSQRGLATVVRQGSAQDLRGQHGALGNHENLRVAAPIVAWRGASASPTAAALA
jgi:hypothetical protein